MNAKCTACGGKTSKYANYFVTAKNMLGQTNLIGALGVGMCRNCILKYTISFLPRHVISTIIMFLLAFICGTMIIFLSGLGTATTMQYTILAAFTALFLAGMVGSIIKLLRIIRNLRHPEDYLKRITPAEVARIGAKMLLKKTIISENIFFSWPTLFGLREEIDTNGLTPDIRAKLREPFRLPMRRQLSLFSFRRHELRIPYTNIPNTMDKSVRELISAALGS